MCDTYLTLSENERQWCSNLVVKCCYEHLDGNESSDEVGILRAMGGGGFEPPKQDAADLQSVPFGHSGNHPY